MCWHRAYSGILDQSFLDSVTVETRLQRIQRKLNEGAQGLIRYEGSALTALALYGPTNLEPEAPTLAGAGEVTMLYVHPDVIGTGLGHKLLIATQDALISQGYSTLCLDVFSANTRAIRFYESHGYTRVCGFGLKIDHIPGHEYPLDIMMKMVNPTEV